MEKKNRIRNKKKLEVFKMINQLKMKLARKNLHQEEKLEEVLSLKSNDI